MLLPAGTKVLNDVNTVITAISIFREHVDQHYVDVGQFYTLIAIFVVSFMSHFSVFQDCGYGLCLLFASLPPCINIEHYQYECNLLGWRIVLSVMDQNNQ